ncbi:MAG: hypothetical protein M3443_01030 [Actinomycetota bacterium]|nr:hypothetical protein [Actinomycetota bacterium]
MLAGCGSDAAPERTALAPSTTTVPTEAVTSTRPPSRQAQQVSVRTVAPACQAGTTASRGTALAGDIYVAACRDTVVGYDLVRQSVAWTRPLGAPVLTLAANDAVAVAYVDRSVPASGLAAARRSIVAVGLNVQGGEQVWDREVSVSSTLEPYPLTHAQAKVVVLPVAGDQFAVVDNGGAEKWRTPPLAIDVVIADNGKLILATPTYVHPSSGNKVPEDLTNVYDAESGRLVGRVPDVDTQPWSAYGLHSPSLGVDWLDLRTGKVLRQLRSKTGYLLRNTLLEDDSSSGPSANLAAITETGATRWTLPETVVADFAVIGGRLFVTNRSGQVIEVSEETGTEERQWERRPAVVGTHWAILATGAAVSVRPLD